MSAAATVSTKLEERVEAGPSDEAKEGKRKRSKSLSKPKRRDGKREPSRQESLGSAIVRALIGSLAFLFKRPVRLFRPVKLSSWTILEAMAKREGRNVSLRYLRSLIKRERSSFLPHLLGPPLLVNTAIGFTLFEAYSLTESRLLAGRKKEGDAQQWTPPWIVTVSGAAAGAAQCFLSAPLDNVRYILQRNVDKQGKSQQIHRISWRAVLRAAVLPFTPAIAREKLVTDLHAATMAKTQNKRLSSAERRKIWEQRLRRWRGGVHGAGLALSLIRDSVGFGSFFFIFEVSRRCAFETSTSIDRAFAWINAKGAGTVGGPTQDGTGPMQSDGEGDVHIEGNVRDWIREGQRGITDADLSYNQSRTVQGRVVAVIILLIGGAIGALSYELVGRPFELMRVVIWEGRKEWEQGKREPSAKKHRTAKASQPSDAGVDTRGRSAIKGARRARKSPLAPTRRTAGLLMIRSLNSAGTRRTRILELASLGRPRHPLELGGSHSAKREQGTEKKRVQSNVRLTTSRAVHGGARKYTAPPRPTLATRPGFLTLLIEHAQKTAKFDRRYGAPDPARTTIPLLLLHTYFIAPFLRELPHKALDNKAARSVAKAVDPKSVSTVAQRTLLMSIASRRKHADTPEDKVRRNWIRNNPVNSSLAIKKGVQKGARHWGQGRVAWSLKRLATPYGVAFLVFAWMGGDLS